MMKAQNTLRQMLFSVVAVTAVAAICYPFTEFIGYRSVALILLLVVSILAMRQGLPAVITAALLGALIWDFFFIPPRFTLTIGSGEDALLILMYFIVATLNGIIQYRLRQMSRLQYETKERERSIKLYNALFNSLSHDLRTPIAAVLGAADTLNETDVQLSPQQRAVLLSEITGNALRLNEQVDNLLNMSRLEAGMIHARKAWCDLKDLVYGTVKKLIPNPSEYPISIIIPPDFPLVQLDYGLSEHILLNLLNNARRHTPPGTRITIEARMLKISHGHFETDSTNNRIKPVKEADTHLLQLEVMDEGPGIPPEDVARIFDKFYRSEATKADGTGLGLYVAGGFVEAQGGEISVRNRLTGGACFTIEIPTVILSQQFHDND